MMDPSSREYPAAAAQPAGHGRRASEKLRARQSVVDAVFDPQSIEGLRPGVVRRVPNPSPDWNLFHGDAAFSARPVVPPLRSATEFCRQARRLRATYGRNPAEMHRLLKGLRISNAGRAPAADAQIAVESPSWALNASRFFRAQASWLLRNASGCLTKFARTLHITPRTPEPAGFGEPSRPVRNDAEDSLPRYTLVDPEEPTCDDAFTGCRDRTFGAMVMRTLQSHPTLPLRYSQRLELLKEAARRGIGRFEANLMIASVQHRMKCTAPRTPDAPPRRFGGVLAYVLMQTMILWGAWRVVR